MSQCHLKLSNWKRAIDTADKAGRVLLTLRISCWADATTQAIAINPKNYKALYRKAKAQGELGYFEKAEKILEDLLVKNPDGVQCSPM